MFLCQKAIKNIIIFKILVVLSMWASTTLANNENSKLAEQSISELSGVVWQLVEIQSMDDSTTKPNEGGIYSLEFNADGSVRIQVDCNHGKAMWYSEQSGKLEFSKIATTKMMCTKQSIDQKFLSELSWVRSYVIKEDHLFLATMADGSILEFETTKTKKDK